MKISKHGDVWVAQSSYEERALLGRAGAGWWWHGGNCREYCKGCQYNVPLKIWWTFELAKASKLAQFADDSCREELQGASEKREAAQAASRALDSNVDIPCPQGLAYMPFQKAGIARAAQTDSLLIADEMGLGKTIQALGVINMDPGIKRVLVICPANVKLNWVREAEKWLIRDFNFGVVFGKFWPSSPSMPTFVVINYDILHTHEQVIRETEWDLVIVDEIHYLKDPEAGRSKQVFGFKLSDWTRKKCNRALAKAKTETGRAKITEKFREITQVPARKRLALTGTPIINRTRELFPILQWLDPESWPNFFGYAKRYCAAYQKDVYVGVVWDFSGSSNLEELQEKLRSTIMVRRLKKDVLSDLPPKTRQVIELPQDGASKVVATEAKAYSLHQEGIEDLKARVELAKKTQDQEGYKEAVELLQSGLRHAFEEMAAARHAVAVAKIPAILAHLEDAIESSGKVIFFCHHKDVVKAVENHFKDVAVKITGDVASEKRQQVVEEFQTNPAVKLFIGSIRAAAEGITLTAASHVVFGEMDWTPGKMNQAEDRAHRIGQKNNVLIQHLVLEGSLDVQMAKTLVEKQDIADRALDTKVVPAPLVIPEAAQAKAKAEVKALPADQMGAIHEGLVTLAGLSPDGVALKNDQGYNGADLRFGIALAKVASLSPRQALAARRMLKKYHRQLGKDLIAAMGK